MAVAQRQMLARLERGLASPASSPKRSWRVPLELTEGTSAIAVPDQIAKWYTPL